jgi:hypothetical protein
LKKGSNITIFCVAPRSNATRPIGSAHAASSPYRKRQPKNKTPPLRWSLEGNVLLDNLTMHMFLVNGKVDH